MKHPFRRIVFPGLISLLVGFLYFYLFLPAINLRAFSMWFMLFLVAAAYIVSYVLLTPGPVTAFIGEVFRRMAEDKPNKKRTKKRDTDFYGDEAYRFPRWAKISLISVGGVLGLVLVLSFFTSSRMTRADSYHQLLAVEDGDFQTDIAEIPISQIPVVDRDTAERLGDRAVGEVGDLVSQFTVSSYYTQINYNNKPYRVSPLQYDGFLKWISNKDAGITHYISTDMATQDTNLIRLEKGIRYSPSEYFGRDLHRYVRFHYPTKLFLEESFEIDDSGNPYWVMPYYTYTIGLFGGKDVQGIVLVNAQTGEMTDYAVGDVPTWIDRVYPAEMIISQANDWGKYSGGFWNSIFIQKNCFVTTDGYNYLALQDDVWLYTGITSVTADESNIGFILVNMRTKEAKRYDIKGAEEYSAMESAQGQIQEKGYVATFPILINVEGVPSYFIGMKDGSGIVKAYALVSVEDYQIVGVGNTIEKAQKEYLELLGIEATVPSTGALTQLSGQIVEIGSAVENGASVYYFRMLVDGESAYRQEVFVAPLAVSRELPFLKEGSQITVLVDENGTVRSLTRTLQ